SRRVVTYGTAAGADFRIRAVDGLPSAAGCLSRFRVHHGERDLGLFRLHVPGTHNVLNATAAIAIGVGLDLKIEAIHEALDAFRGVDRRFQAKGMAGGVTVID